MSLPRTIDHPFIPAIAWEPAKPAERINDFLLMSRSTSNTYVVTSEDGDVVINTALAAQGQRTRERFEELLGRPLAVKKIVYTQSHPDHTGGWQFFADPGVETIGQRLFPQICAERKLLGEFFGPRNQRVLAALVPPGSPPHNWFDTRDPEDMTLFVDTHAFTVGGRQFELISTPAGETLDSLVVWLPQEKVLFVGNLMGAIYGAPPHFSTIRGDRQRSVPRFIADMARLIALEPEMLVTGHGAPTIGKANVVADLTKLHDAVSYIHDETVKGMNAQKDVKTLMREIALPDHLVLAPGRGPTSWYVRAVWEEYAGWFQHASTTELYGVPPSDVWAEVTALAGGAAVLAERAQARVAAGEPVAALHLVEMALAAEPGNRPALEAELAAYEALASANEGRHFDELGWLEGRMMATKAALGKS